MVNPIHVRDAQGVALPKPTPARTNAFTGGGFSSALRDAMATPANITFSGHALQRLESRGITLDTAQQQALSGALDEAAAKGARDVVLLMERTAFVANVPNRTVITAVDVRDGENAVFTNVDSVVVIAPHEQSELKLQPKSAGLDPFRGSPRAVDR